MKGTEKQIKWARDIKAKLIADINKLNRYMREYKNDPDKFYDNKRNTMQGDIGVSFPQMVHYLKPEYRYAKTINAIKNSQDARWFIDNGRNGIHHAIATAKGYEVRGKLL